MGLQVLFSICVFRVLTAVFKVCIIFTCFPMRNAFELARLLVIDGCIIAWLFKGYWMMFTGQTDNDCLTNTNTQPYAFIMCTILGFGNVLMVGYFIILLIISKSLMGIGNAG